MSDRDDGGPAFPSVESHPTMGTRGDTGMSLRDWFAGMALANQYTFDDCSVDKVAQWAYFVADEMLKARNQ